MEMQPIERILLFILGAIFVGGGGVFTVQAFEDAKNVFESLVFSLMIVAAGMCFIMWSINGPPG
ncbi:hypothetical protein BH11CYA1_BH11CYA1_23730 [soil metagenome]